MKSLSLKIPDTLDQRIALEVARRRIGKSALIREAIEEHLAKPSTPGKRQSFLDLAGDLIGRRRGPGDLSSNPKYMKNFGK
jgi:hypothetical protein